MAVLMKGKHDPGFEIPDLLQTKRVDEFDADKACVRCVAGDMGTLITDIGLADEPDERGRPVFGLVAVAVLLPIARYRELVAAERLAKGDEAVGS
jgi:hypothetical protein